MWSARGGITALGAQGAKFLLNFGSTVIMARLLAPEDFGLVAMVAPIVGLLGLVKDLGLSAATVQRSSVTLAQISTLFWVNVALSAALAAATALLAPLVARFYGEPRLVWVTVALGSLMLCGGLTAQHLGLLQRQMRFARLAAIEVASLLAGVAAGIAAAWQGLDHWALVLMTAANAVVNLALVWLASGWRPGRPVRGAGVRPMLAFGGNLTAAAICQHLNRNLDNVLIGKVWGEAALGLYSRAYSLLLLPISQFNGPVSGIAVPVLSRLQNEPARYREYYGNAVGLLVTLGMPTVAFTCVDARILVLALLGEKWLDAVPMFQALAPAAFVGTFNVATGWVYITLGRTNRQLRWALFQSPIIVAGFILGLPHGPLGVATAYSIVSLGLRLPAILYCFRGTPLRIADLVQAITPAAIASLGAAMGILLLHGALPPDGANAFSFLALDLLAYAILYFALYAATAGGRRNFAILVALVRRAGFQPPWPRRRLPIGSKP